MFEIRYVSKEQFPDSVYPPYCHGFGYFFPVRTLAVLLAAVKKSTYITVEDAYFTGIVRRNANVTMVGDPTLTDAFYGTETKHAIITSKSSKDEEKRYGRVMAAFVDSPTVMVAAHVHDRRYLRLLWCMLSYRERLLNAAANF